MPSNEYWTLDEIEAFMSKMGDYDITHMEIGDLKITRHPKIEFHPFDQPEKQQGEKLTEDEMLFDPMKGID